MREAEESARLELGTASAQQRVGGSQTERVVRDLAPLQQLKLIMKDKVGVLVVMVKVGVWVACVVVMLGSS